MKKQQQIQSIYLMRLLAMSLVVLVHVTGAYATVLPFASDAYEKYHFLNRIIRIEAGIFIAITGLVFFYQYKHKKLTKTLWKDYYRKRVSFILIPYIIWALVYELHKAMLGFGDLQPAAILKRIIFGESYYQLHFIFLIVQVYLVLPLLIWLDHSWAFFRRYMFVFGGLLQLGYIALQTFFPPSPFPLFLQLMGTLLLGGWIGVHYDREKAKSKHWSTWIWLLISALAGSGIAMYYYAAGTLGSFEWNNILYESVNYIFLITGCYAIFRIAESVSDKLAVSTLAKLQQIASYSFGYYLLHPLVLDYVTRTIPAYSNYLFHVQIMLRYLAVMGVCFTVIYLFHRFVPFASILFGKLPRSSGRLKQSKAS
ncbi:Surface polysaccharide O-acyltransferase, integral membrane enzyme [Terribacillus halophilus]|uniref:Surface polysaccharide O-acyltransferase, integral membrane enzyme n=1 Tax=Terribacillus halophilus TaxID=361279 RepID=A0A1G6SSN7_9BACI|nr:acyltransferase [Terribacillus halophilus]SDD19651.1 Surface polysaccharide O-acyltransferase, integral membrane enzyme [Terribacillus halophilus]